MFVYFCLFLLIFSLTFLLHFPLPTHGTNQPQIFYRFSLAQIITTRSGSARRTLATRSRGEGDGRRNQSTFSAKVNQHIVFTRIRAQKSDPEFGLNSFFLQNA
ncbi:hypothetical protein BKA91DRAFT_32268 [Yarrowia lipolytica]|nr:hypothetical protein BKA91DRAFT_32268 [Yarrowia lipolytica]KAE8169788.1 hypothetical protein BKA90DRAFT_44773 [Yarrowia lipolytica]RMI95290.1 hypothetical protein BD777DRAFT_13608 [Yarrowia lipolytica]